MVSSRGRRGMTGRVGPAVLTVLACLSIGTAVSAQTGAAGDRERPVYQPQRSDEDWGFLRDASRRRDPWDPIKFIPLRPDGKWHMTLGGELRPFVEFYDNYNWGAGPEASDGYYLQRVMLHADVQMA